PKILCDRSHFHADSASPQFDGEMSEIGIAGYEDDNIGPHLDGKLECIDCHHHVHVRLVTAFFGGRPIFGHDHESIGTQPMHELVLLVPLLLPERDRGRQPSVDYHLDQFPPCAWARQKLAQFQPIQTAPRRAHRAADVRFIDKNQHSRAVTFGIFLSLHVFEFRLFSLSQAITALRRHFANSASSFASALVTCLIASYIEKGLDMMAQILYKRFDYGIRRLNSL